MDCEGHTYTSINLTTDVHTYEMSYRPQTTQAKLLRLYMHLYKVSLKLKNLSKFKILSQKQAFAK